MHNERTSKPIISPHFISKRPGQDEVHNTHLIKLISSSMYISPLSITFMTRIYTKITTSVPQKILYNVNIEQHMTDTK